MAQHNWFQRTFLDWHLPWWVSIVLYVVIAVGWLLCFYSTLLYGVKFDDEKVHYLTWRLIEDVVIG